MAIKAFLMQNLSLIALLVLEIWRHKISLGRREQVMKFGYLPPENRFNFKKMSFYVQNRSSRPKIDPSCQFQEFSSIGKIFHFQNFWDVSMRKEQQQPPWLTNFAKMWPKGVSRIKTKSHQVWASLDKRFLIGSCEFGHPGLWTPPPWPDRVKDSTIDFMMYNRQRIDLTKAPSTRIRYCFQWKRNDCFASTHCFRVVFILFSLEFVFKSYRFQ